jgi:hypothetical protein
MPPIRSHESPTCWLEGRGVDERQDSARLASTLFSAAADPECSHSAVDTLAPWGQSQASRDLECDQTKCTVAQHAGETTHLPQQPDRFAVAIAHHPVADSVSVSRGGTADRILRSGGLAPAIPGRVPKKTVFATGHSSWRSWSGLVQQTIRSWQARSNR